MAVSIPVDGGQISSSSAEELDGLLTYHLRGTVRSGSRCPAEACARLRLRVEDEAKAEHNSTEMLRLTPDGERLKGRLLVRR